MKITIFGLLGTCMFAGGCMLMDARDQQKVIDNLCVMEGSVASASATLHPMVVILARYADASGAAHEPQIVDHFVLEQPGKWTFLAPPGLYRVAAFDDSNADLVYQPGESFAGTPADPKLTCAVGGRLTNIALSIPLSSPRLDQEIDVNKLQVRSLEAQTEKTLGQLTVVGEIASLTDDRFSLERAEDSLWRPFDAAQVTQLGIYFIEPYDARKIPVLFVHGISGSPANFSYLVEHLDRSRFQPWMYSYPSGVHLNNVANHLAQTVAKLRAHYHFERMALVAHSMGGLVARGYLLRDARQWGANNTQLFVSMSTPYSGHKAAEMGVKHSPVVVRVWEDMVPGSEYLQSIFAQPLPAGVQHHLLFTFKGNSFGEANDGVVTVVSQMNSTAQQQAQRLYGFDDTHDGILENAEASALLNRLLAQYY